MQMQQTQIRINFAQAHPVRRAFHQMFLAILRWLTIVPDEWFEAGLLPGAFLAWTRDGLDVSHVPEAEW